jgi:glutaminyl-peptide cyclotransferase
MKQGITASIIKPCRQALVTLLNAVGLKSTIKELLRAASNWGIPKSEPHILRMLPHDPEAFTQGLHIHDGVLYESTGIMGCSSLRVIDRQTGEVLKSIGVEDQFAEGIAALGEQLVQLTWHGGKAMVYRLPDLAPLEPYSYTGEAWGMSANAEHYLISNGSDEIVYRNRQFDTIKSLKVRINGFPLKGINDLAWAKGKIYCNVLHDDNIYEIDERSGKVLHILNCSRLVDLPAQPRDSNVLNGIAYDQQTDTFFITGKRWKDYFQVKFT